MISLQTEWDRLSKLKASHPAEFEKGLQAIISSGNSLKNSQKATFPLENELTDENLLIIEEAILTLGALYSKNKYFY